MFEGFLTVLKEMWVVLNEMAPWLLFGFFFAGLLSIIIPPELIERHLGKKGFKQVAKASIFGVPLPLCSCGVIPMAASLRRHGAGGGATTSFLISTPQTGVDSIFVTLSLLGPVYAIFRPVAAFVSGILGGTLVNLFGTPEPVKKQAQNGCQDECCNGSTKRNKFASIFHYGFVTLPSDIAGSLIIGIILAGLISAFIPLESLDPVFKSGILAMLLMMVIGIPLYVCATGSIPIAAALIAKGVSPGVALVFLITGPATNAASISMIVKLLGKRTAAVYLFSVGLTALASGLILDHIYTMGNFTAKPWMEQMFPPWFTILCSITLLAVLINSVYGHRKKGEAIKHEVENTKTETFKISGMTCSHCVQNVTKAIASVPGVGMVDIDLKSGAAKIGGSTFNRSQIERTVTDMGYKVE